MRHIKLFLFLIAILCWFHTLAYSQSLNVCAEWRDFTNANGSTCVALDGKYVWVGTEGGLIRFDTTTNTHELFLKTNSGLPVNWINALVRDQAGVMWIGTMDGGLASYDHGSWTSYTPLNSNLPGWDVLSLAADSTGNVWIGTVAGLAVYLHGFGILAIPLAMVPATYHTIQALAVDRTGMIWIGADGANNFSDLVKYDASSGTATVFSSQNSTIDDDLIMSIACAPDTTVWVGFEIGGVLQQFDGTSWTDYVAQPSGGGISPLALAIDDSNDVWIADYIGVGELKNYEWQTFAVGGSNSVAASGNEAWVASDGVVHIHGTTWDRYTDFSNCTLTSNRLSDGALTVDQQGETWATTFNASSFALGHDTTWKTIVPANYHKNAMSVGADSSGNVWIGYQDTGLLRYAGMKWTLYTDSNSAIPSNRIKTITYDKKSGKLWIGTYLNGGGGPSKSGCAVFDGTKWTGYPGDAMGFPGGYAEINGIAVDTSGNVWAGAAYQGISEFDGNSWHLFTTSNSGLPDNFITSVAADHTGAVWIGCNGGLAKYLNGTWTVFNTKNSPIPGDDVTAVAVDTEGRVWIGTFYEGGAIYDHGKWLGVNTWNSGITNDWNITKIAVDSHDNVWFANAYMGIAEYSKSGFTNGLTLFANDTASGCNAATSSSIPLTGFGCTNRQIVSQTIVGKDSAYYSITHAATTGLLGEDSIVIQFSPDANRVYNAVLEIGLADGSVMTIPLSGYGKGAQTLSLSSSDVTADTIGEIVSVPIVISGAAALDSAKIELHYDGSVLVYHGSIRRSGAAADQNGESVSGRSKLTFQASDLHSSDTIGYATFAVYPTQPCTAVTFDSLTYTSASGTCVTLSNPSAVANICSPIVCGTSLLSNFLRNGTISEFKLTPNPASSLATLTTNLPIANAQVEILDCLGAVKQRERAALGPDHSLILDIGNLPEGAYFLRVTGSQDFSRVIPFTHF